MTTIGKIENLAEGEEIKSARFMGDTGYFVTYENTDPLFQQIFPIRKIRKSPEN